MIMMYILFLFETKSKYLYLVHVFSSLKIQLTRKGAGQTNTLPSLPIKP